MKKRHLRKEIQFIIDSLAFIVLGGGTIALCVLYTVGLVH